VRPTKLCVRCKGTGLKFPKAVPDGVKYTLPDKQGVILRMVPHPYFDEGARCVPCGGMGKISLSPQC